MLIIGGVHPISVLPIKAVFVYDIEGWAFHQKYLRLRNYFKLLQTEGHAVFPNIAGPQGAPPALPPADVYFFMSWYLCSIYARHRMIPSGALVVNAVTNEYGFERSATAFATAHALADVTLTQSLRCLYTHPDTIFLPNPADEAYWQRLPRMQKVVRGRPFQLGMVASCHRRLEDDHKGAALARSILDRLVPHCELHIAGSDRIYRFDEMPSFYQGLDALLILSRSEAFTPVASEALLSGIPVISTPVLPMEPFLGPSCYYPIPSREKGTIEDYIDSISAHLRTIAVKPDNVQSKCALARTKIDAWRAPHIARRIETVVLGLFARNGVDG